VRQEPTPKQAGDVLKDVLRKARLNRRVVGTDLQAIWTELVGETAAERSRILGWDGAVLKIAVRSAALRQELETFRKHELLTQLKEKLNRPLDDLRFEIDG
jgi:hypothetical protein